MSNTDRIAQILRERFKYSVRRLKIGSEWIDTGPEAVKVEDLAAEIDAALHPVIETAEQLDALPDHSIIRCAAGAAWHKQELHCAPGEPWWCAGSEIEGPASDVMLPARVLYAPEVDR